MNKAIENLRERYAHIHPLIFHRSEEKAKSPGDLFDILDTIPDYPIIWNEQEHRWVQIDDIFLKHNFKPNE